MWARGTTNRLAVGLNGERLREREREREEGEELGLEVQLAGRDFSLNIVTEAAERISEQEAERKPATSRRTGTNRKPEER